jgi:hypothetical protein
MEQMDLIHHSAAVHIPLALSILLPVLYFVIWISIERHWFTRRTWLLLAGLAVIQVLTCYMAWTTGMRDRTLSSSNPDLINQHQQLGIEFMQMWFVISIFLILAFVTPKKFALVFRGLLVVLFATQLVWAVRLGQLGGNLVFGS